jgi:hypothetical protein
LTTCEVCCAALAIVADRNIAIIHIGFIVLVVLL